MSYDEIKLSRFRLFWSPIVILICLGCTTPQGSVTTTSKSEMPRDTKVQISKSPQEFEERVDLDGLQRSLGMDRPIDQLGFRERAFATCRAGYGFSPSHNCRQSYLVVVNFRIQCRDSEGTVSDVTNEELRPVTTDRLTWHLGGKSGEIATDGNGFGQVRLITERPSRNQRLRLTVNEDFLFLPAGEAKRLIVPRPWCELN